MDLEKTCSPCGTKLLWKVKILLIQDALDRSTANVCLGKQIRDSDLENFRQIEDMNIEDGSNARFDLCHGHSRDIPATALKLGRKFDLRPTMPIPQLTHLRSYDIAVPHSARATQAQKLVQVGSGLSRFVSKARKFVTKRAFSTLRHTVLKPRKARRKRAKFALSHRHVDFSKRNLIAAFGDDVRFRLEYAASAFRATTADERHSPPPRPYRIRRCNTHVVSPEDESEIHARIRRVIQNSREGGGPVLMTGSRDRTRKHASISARFRPRSCAPSLNRSSMALPARSSRPIGQAAGRPIPT
jgi:hypothetical protein